MRKATQSAKKEDATSLRPSLSPEAQEQKMVYLATKLAEEQLLNKTASSQVITHYLKLGSMKEKLEKEILEKQKGLIEAKTEALQSAKRIEELYGNAMAAFRKYSGQDDGDLDEY